MLVTTDFISSFLTKKDTEAILSLPVMLFALRHIDLCSAPGWWSEPLSVVVVVWGGGSISDHPNFSKIRG